VTVITAVALLATACNSKTPPAAGGLTSTTAAPSTTGTVTTSYPTRYPTRSPSSSTTTATPTTVTNTTTAAPTTVANTTTAAPTTVANTTTTIGRTPLAPPNNLVCLPAGGSTEYMLAWDTPADPSAVAGVRVYLSESGGPFNLLNDYPVADGFIYMGLSGGTQWRVSAYPINNRIPIEMAVALYDDSGSESARSTIDAFLFHAAGPCNSGPPPAPSSFKILRGAGSGEIEMVFTGLPRDVTSFAVAADQGTGFVDLTMTYGPILDEVTDQTLAVFQWIDTFAPATYRVVSIDAHGNRSPVVERSCPPIPAVGDSC